MNLSEVITRIKLKLGIMNLASPVRNLDGMITTIVKDITVPDFSIYNPDRYTTRISLNDLEKIEDTNSYETYLLPDFHTKKLLYVYNVYYDDSTLSGFGHYGGALPMIGGNMIGQVAMSNAAASMYSVMMPKMTFQFIHPRTLRIYNQYSESKIVLDLGFQHDVSLASIPETCRTSFMELALLDVKENLYPIFRSYANLNTAYGNIDLKIDSWEQAESERRELIQRWDDNYHLDAGPGIYYA
jgi:hypothetical protein